MFLARFTAISSIRRSTADLSPPMCPTTEHRLSALQRSSTELRRLILFAPPKSCELDHIPTFLLLLIVVLNKLQSYSRISALGPEGHCTSRFKRAMCISCRPHVDVHKGVWLMWAGGSKSDFFADVINGWLLTFSTCVRDLAVMLDPELTFSHHINLVARSATISCASFGWFLVLLPTNPLSPWSTHL